MPLGEITKQLALQAIGNAAAPDPPPPVNLGAAIVVQIQAMQKALKDDQELLILCHTGGETVRVVEVFVPTWQLFVLTGLDAHRNTTRVVVPAEALQLTCKVMKAPPGATPGRVAFKTPKLS